MHRPLLFAMLTTAAALSLSPAFAQPRAVEIKPPPVRAVTAPRPIVIVGGYSNCPAHFSGTSLVRELEAQRGKERVLLTTHADRFGDIDANARAEAAQIVSFLDKLGGVNDFDLVGFSMGGLVVRSMVLKNASALGRYQVANLVTMATPNHGANPFLTNIDPGVTLMISGDECDGRRGVVYNGNIAARQMAPDSDFLRDLNGRQIPASIRVTTIAGDVEVDVAQPSVEREVAPVLCNANCTPVGPPLLVAANQGGFTYVDQWRGECRAANGSCKQVTQCPSHQDKFSDGGVWKCRAKVATPTTTTARQKIGSDAFIRVSSVRLTAGEAASIAAQHVFTGIYHTPTTEDKTRGGPSPKPLVSAVGIAPTNPGTPIMGTAVDGSWFFEDGRVTEVLKGLPR